MLGTLNTLNPAQREAADVMDGPVLVIAGAGTGKTHTLIHRLAHLVDSGVEPESILLLTFTRRAAEEMIARAADMVGGEERRAAGGTFHSFANRILRRYGRDIDVPADFTILDQSDTFEILSGIRSELKETDPYAELPRRETIATIISKAINKQAPIDEIVSEEFPQHFGATDYLDIAASRYETYKKERNLVDFDNLLVLLIRLLEESDEARARVNHRYRYVMVDEYQDTNVLRGANHRNLFDFKEAFPGARVVTLEQN